MLSKHIEHVSNVILLCRLHNLSPVSIDTQQRLLFFVYAAHMLDLNVHSLAVDSLAVDSLAVDSLAVDSLDSMSCRVVDNSSVILGELVFDTPRMNESRIFYVYSSSGYSENKRVYDFLGLMNSFSGFF